MKMISKESFHTTNLIIKPLIIYGEAENCARYCGDFEKEREHRVWSLARRLAVLLGTTA